MWQGYEVILACSPHKAAAVQYVLLYKISLISTLTSPVIYN